jgi:succinate dehydrogenase/fumarate reductase cytochrome b subunit
MIESGSTDQTHIPLTATIVPPWAGALLAAALYPSLLTLFPIAIQGMSAAENVALQNVWVACAIAAMALLFSVPLLALWALMKVPARATPKAIAMRRVLHVACAVPPLYGFSRLWAGRMGVVDWHALAWVVVVIGAALYVIRARDDQVMAASRANVGSVLRSVHRATAVGLFVGFLFVHILNHGVALWSVELQQSWMAALRLWYRAIWVEPVLLGALCLMVLTGIPLMLRNTRTGGNQWRTLQSVAGVYIIVFLCSHISAVLLARADGRDTDWVFATGRNGMIAGSPNQIPYYVFSIAALMVHVALGARMAMLRRSVESAHVNRVFSALMWFAGLTTLWVTAAVLGVELAS